MRIQHNIAALNSYRQLNSNNSAVSKNLEKLSSGYKINRAGDDAAGLAISEKMRAQITGLETAQKNAQDGISLVQTAEGNLQEVHSMLNRMVELATQSANGTYDNDVDRANLQKEVNSLKSEINRISESANYNGINLLDGSLAENDAAKINFDTVSTTKGMTLETGANGKGAKGEFSLDFSNGLFGTGDTITIEGTKTDGATAISTTLTFGTDIKGSTAEEQAQSIAEALNKNVSFAQNFDIKADGAKVTFVSKEEGATKSAITTATVTDKTASATGGGGGSTAATVAGGLAKAGWDGLFGTGGTGANPGHDLQANDVVKFNFEDINGKKLTAEVTITQGMIDASSGSLETLTEKIVDELKNTKFNDIAGSAADESLIKVSDMFDIKANTAASGDSVNGSIQVETKAGGNAGGKVGTVEVMRGGSMVGTAATGVNGTPATAGSAQIYEISASTTGNLSAGDNFAFSGTLSDGRNFSVDLVAGRDFEIGADYATTASNMIAALNDGKIKITVGTGDRAEQVDSNKIFGTAASTAADKNLEFTAAVDNTGKITLTSTKATTAGKGGAGAISNVNLTTVSNADATLSTTKGVDQGYASSNIKLDKDLQYGSALKIGDKTFEFVKDARDVTSRNNIAVVVNDIENASAADIAQKLADAAKANGFVDEASVSVGGQLNDALIQAAKANGSVGIISFSGNEVTVTGMEKGSTAKAPKLSTLYGDKVNVAEMKFDPSKLNYGDQFSINGKTYEFVANEDDASEGSIGVVVEDIKNASAKDVATALADVAQGVKTSVGEDGTITIQSMADADGNIAKPSIVFEGKGLSLQVGDTNKDYQRVNVKIGSMSAESLDIDDVNIGTQEGAAAAIDKVKAAINTVSSTRGDLGAIQNRLEHTINNLGVTTENMTAAESRIRDTDMAKEMMQFTKNNILVQASQAMLAQANQLPQGVLQLLQ